MLEERVKNSTIFVLVDLLEEYIRTYTNNGRYEGKLNYLISYNNIMEYIKKWMKIHITFLLDIQQGYFQY